MTMSPRTEYATYLQSAAWRAKAKAAIQRAGNRCQLCSRPGSQVHLDAHHRTYARIGSERDEDIEVLCKACHALRVPFRHVPPKRIPPALDLVPAPTSARGASLTPVSGPVPSGLQLLPGVAAGSATQPVLQLLPVTERAPVLDAPQRERYVSLQTLGAADAAAQPPSRRLHALPLAWLVAIMAGTLLLWTVVTALNGAPAASQAAAQPDAAAARPPAPLPTTTPVTSPHTPSDPLAALTAFQADHYRDADYTATCPYTRTSTNLRRRPGSAQSDVIAVVPSASCVPLSAQTEDGAWFAFALDLDDHRQTLAWVAAELVVDAPGDLPHLAAQSGELPTGRPKPLPLRTGATAAP